MKSLDTTKNITAKRYPNKVVKEKTILSLPISSAKVPTNA